MEGKLNQKKFCKAQDYKVHVRKNCFLVVGSMALGFPSTYRNYDTVA